MIAEDLELVASRALHPSRESAGLAWWNGMARAERAAVLARAAECLGEEASPAGAFVLWENGVISMEL